MPQFKLPEGFQVPEGVKPGQPFEVLATVVMDQQGQAELVEVEGQSIPGYEDKKEKPNPEQNDYVDLVAATAEK